MSTRRPPPTNRTDEDGERRVTSRYPASKSPVMIGWWAGSEFQSAEMVLRDVSLSGASALTRTPPPDSDPIWLRLNDPAYADWVEATVVAITRRFWGPALVRMKFREPCPYEFYKAAIRGIVPPGGADESIQTGHRDHYWGGQYWD